MAEYTLDVRVQTLEGEVFQMHQKDQKRQKNQRLQKEQKLDGVQWPSSGGSEITSRNTRYARAYAHTLQEFCVFCCHKCHTNSITHYVITVYIDFRNNISHFHAATPPQKLPKTPSSKQLFDLQSKTTRCFPQNDRLFPIKRHVTFHKTIRCFK